MANRRIVVAQIEKKEKVLITQLSTGSWELPGGQVRNDETDKEAIVREIYDKMHISVKCNEKIFSKKFKTESGIVEIVLYNCSYLSGEVILNNYKNHIFVDKSILNTYKFTKPDQSLINYIVNKQV